MSTLFADFLEERLTLVEPAMDVELGYLRAVFVCLRDMLDFGTAVSSFVDFAVLFKKLSFS